MLQHVYECLQLIECHLTYMDPIQMAACSADLPLIFRTLLWRRDDNLCYALLQGGKPEKGEGVMSKVKAIIEVM